ncbi:MAG: flagellar biosynthetic protein FliR, partial [Pseudomonadota bacterium]
MNALAAELYGVTSSLALALPRILVAFAMLPLFDRERFPLLARTGVALVLALAVLPLTLVDRDPVAIAPVLVAFVVVKEAFVGLLIGLFAATTFWLAQGAGRLIDVQRG